MPSEGLTRGQHKPRWLIMEKWQVVAAGGGNFGGTKEKSHFVPQFPQLCLGLVQEFLSKVYVIFKS